MLVFIHLLALIGTTLIVVRGSILAPARKLAPALLGCAQCSGAWIGAAAGGSAIIQVGHGRMLDAIVIGAATSFSAMLADATLLKLLGDPNEKDQP